MAEAYTVSRVNSYIKNMFQTDFVLNKISVKGEVSNCKYHTSGHLYFTIKDGGGTLSCVMWKSSVAKLSFRLAEGQQVIVSGRIDVYEAGSSYQMYATQITEDGTGDLFRRYQELKDELEQMGMFDACYKKRIPRYVSRVGIVTAQTGAAIRDIINIATRRNPYVQLILYPAIVQGKQAAQSIAKGIGVLDKLGVDVIIAGRGGGSIEDLWAFNERVVADAVFSCNTPVISAVGHETDFTIIDFVSDLRAPTPSAAAELAIYDYNDFVSMLEQMCMRMDKAVGMECIRYRDRVNRLMLRLKNCSPQHMLDERRMRLNQCVDRLNGVINEAVNTRKHRLAVAAARLEGVSPLKKLAQGYSYVTGQDGDSVNTITAVSPGDELDIYMTDGKVRAQVKSTEELSYSITGGN